MTRLLLKKKLSNPIIGRFKTWHVMYKWKIPWKKDIYFYTRGKIVKKKLDKLLANHWGKKNPYLNGKNFKFSQKTFFYIIFRRKPIFSRKFSCIGCKLNIFRAKRKSIRCYLWCSFLFITSKFKKDPTIVRDVKSKRGEKKGDRKGSE